MPTVKKRARVESERRTEIGWAGKIAGIGALTRSRSSFKDRATPARALRVVQGSFCIQNYGISTNIGEACELGRNLIAHR